MSTVGEIPTTTTPFISTWRTTNTSTGSSASTQVKLPLVSGGTYDFIVDWGDGNTSHITVWNVGDTHTYSSSGDYTITISGTIIGWQFAGAGDRLKILDISQWGPIVFLSAGSITTGNFYNCANLNISATDVLTLPPLCSAFFRGCTSLTGNADFNNWNTSACTDLSYFFLGCTNFNQPLNSWDVSSVGTFVGTFSGCTNFNQPLNSWDVSSVTNFSEMFLACSNFNQDIGGWVMSSATSLRSMFRYSAFNNGGSTSIDNWDVSNVTSLGIVNGGVFSNCPFNQPIGSWDTGSIISFVGAFSGNSSFNQDIGSWDVSSGTSFQQMFYNASSFNNGGSSSINSWIPLLVTNFSLMFTSSAFNQPIGSWDVSSGTSFQQMFNNASSFNQNIGSWDVSSATNMAGMFAGASDFNNGGSDTIKNWDVSGVTGFGGTNLGMFMNASAFNQPIGIWDTSAATSMRQMFMNASSFNQNIGSWDVSLVTDFTNFMAGKTAANFSTANLDAIYNGWSALPSLSPNEAITFGTAKYTAGASAGRAILTGSPNNWTITDGGI